MFFDDARTDADLVVGEPGDGWRVAMGTLTFERGVSTLGQQIRYARELSNLVEVAKRTGAADDPLIRERLTRSWAGLQTMRSYALATMDVEQPGQDNVSKLLWANWHRDLGELAMDSSGKAGAGGRQTASSTSGSTCTCSPAPTPSTAGPTRSSATSSPSGCSACPERSKDAMTPGGSRPKEIEGHGLLTGKVVVVTAAAGTGIGSAVARRALAEGADVVVSDHHERRLAETRDQLARARAGPGRERGVRRHVHRRRSTR